MKLARQHQRVLIVIAGGQASNLVDSSQSHGVACQEALDVSVDVQTVNSTSAQLDACPKGMAQPIQYFSVLSTKYTPS